MTAVIRSGALSGYHDLVREMGGAPAALLRECGIDPASLDDEDRLVPLRAQIRLLEVTARALDRGDFGMRLGHRQDIGILGPLALAMQHAPTAGEALHCASQRLFVQSQAVSLSVIPQGPRPDDALELRFELTEGFMGPTRQFMDQCLAVLDRVGRFLAGDRYRLLEVRLDHSPTVDLSVYRRAFGAPVSTANPHGALILERQFLDAPLRSANAVLQKMAFDYMDSRFAEPDKAVSARVRLVLSRSLGSVTTTREYVARSLAMHPRTLQRHLEREGTGFDLIRDEVRRDMVLRYLSTSRLPIEQIASLAGLSQTSALTRCCRRWFGRTPTAIRRDGP